MELLVKAAQELQAGRGREGEQMANAIRERVEGVSRITANVRSWLPEIRDALKQRMLDRIADLQQPLEPGRIEQEVAILSQKIDVDEELDRLDAHLKELNVVLNRDEAVGRRLDFLMQELNREANTVSKSIGKAKDADEREARKEEGRKLREQTNEMRAKLDEIATGLDAIHRLIPNMSHPDAPVGEDDKSNLELGRGKTPLPEFDFEPLDHVGGDGVGVLRAGLFGIPDHVQTVAPELRVEGQPAVLHRL